MSSNPFDDLNAHKSLMKAMEEATDKAILLTEKAAEIEEAIDDHNTDTTAHPDLRKLVTDAASDITDTIDNRISQHDESDTAHADIRELIEAARNDTSAARNAMDELLTTHNTSGTSHADIREAVTILQTAMGDFSFTAIDERLSSVETQIAGEITTDIEALQTADARHDSLIAANSNRIDDINQRIATNASHLAKVASSVSEHQIDIDRLSLASHALQKEEYYGYDSLYEDKEIPNVTEFVCSLPIYVSTNSDVTFKVYGATSATEPDGEITYDLEIGEGDFTLSKDTGINGTDEITMHVGTANTAGSIIWFHVTITDATTGKVTKRVCNTMIARPLSDGLLSLDGLNENVEPGHEYTFTISNLADSADGRFTYTLDAGDSGFTFEPTGELTDGTVVTMSVPDDAVRGSIVELHLTVNDIYSGSATTNINVHVNELPTTDNFFTNCPTLMAPNKSYTVKFNGVKSAQGNDATYSVSSPYTGVTFSKTTGILANENIKVTLAASAAIERGTAFDIVVDTIDENDVALQVTKTVTINQLPSAASIVVSGVPPTTDGGVALTIKFSGGTDTDNNNFTYTINAEDSGIRFSKTMNIAENEELIATLPKVSDQMVKMFSVSVTDSCGESSATSKQVFTIVEPVYVLNAPAITSPTSGATVAYEGFTMTWSELTYDVDMSQPNESTHTTSR